MNQHIDVEGIRQILLATGNKEFTCALAFTVLEKTPEEAAASFMSLMGLEDEDTGALDETITVTSRESGKVWTVTNSEGDIEEAPCFCGRCQRQYAPEPKDDLGICCECFRDVAYKRVYGPEGHEEMGQGTVKGNVMRLAALRPPQISWVLKRLMAYNHSPGHVDDDEIAERLRTLIARTEAL